MNTSEIRQEMGVTRKKGGNRLDKAIIDLQQSFYITVAGSRRKEDKHGLPYGWAVNVYDKVENWVPEEWLKINMNLSSEEAREIILDTGASIGVNINRSQLAKVLGIK